MIASEDDLLCTHLQLQFASISDHITAMSTSPACIPLLLLPLMDLSIVQDNKHPLARAYLVSCPKLLSYWQKVLSRMANFVGQVAELFSEQDKVNKSACEKRYYLEQEQVPSPIRAIRSQAAPLLDTL